MLRYVRVSLLRLEENQRNWARRSWHLPPTPTLHHNSGYFSLLSENKHCAQITHIYFYYIDCNWSVITKRRYERTLYMGLKIFYRWRVSASWHLPLHLSSYTEFCWKLMQAITKDAFLCVSVRPCGRRTKSSAAGRMLLLRKHSIIKQC